MSVLEFLRRAEGDRPAIPRRRYGFAAAFSWATASLLATMTA